MKWMLAGFLAGILFLERNAIYRFLVRIRHTRMKPIKPIYDGQESISEMLAWAAEPTEVKERAERLRDSYQKSVHFRVFIDQVMKGTWSFKEINQQPLPFVPCKLGRWSCTHNGRAWIELWRYADGSRMEPSIRRNQLTQVLDALWEPDSKIMNEIVMCTYKMPDRVNNKILEIALGEEPGQPT